MISYKKLIEVLKRWQKATAAEFDTPVHELVGWAHANLDKLNLPENKWEPVRTGNDSAELRLSTSVFYVVEASRQEAHTLWEKFSKDSGTVVTEGMSWEPCNPGWLVEVGKVEDLPCCISVTFSLIENKQVMFWEPTSRMVDHKMIEDWIAHYFKGKDGDLPAICDASNFHQCRHAILAARKAEGCAPVLP